MSCLPEFKYLVESHIFAQKFIEMEVLFRRMNLSDDKIISSYKKAADGYKKFKQLISNVDTQDKKKATKQLNEIVTLTPDLKKFVLTMENIKSGITS